MLIATVSFPLKLIALDKSEPIPCSDMIIKEKVSCYAKENGVSEKLANYIVENESHYNPNAIGDMNIKCSRTNKPVRARGLLQITECYYPEVTDEQAFDPNFNLDFGMKLMKNKNTCINQFATCRRYYENN